MKLITSLLSLIPGVLLPVINTDQRIKFIILKTIFHTISNGNIPFDVGLVSQKCVQFLQSLNLGEVGKGHYCFNDISTNIYGLDLKNKNKKENR